MTRTGVLSLLVAAYAVTSLNSAQAVASNGNPHHFLGSRSMQAILDSQKEGPNLDTLDEYHDKVFSQFIDEATPRVEGHLMTDKIIYRQNDTVFIDLLVVNALDLTPHVNSGKSYVVSLVDDQGISVNGLAVTLNTAGPAYGLTFKIPIDLDAGNYLIVAEGINMATATRTIVVQAMPVEPVDDSSTAPWLFSWSVFEAEVQQEQAWGLSGKVQIIDNRGAAPAVLSNTLVDFAYSLDDGASFSTSEAITNRNGFAYFFFEYPKDLLGNYLTTSTSEFTVTVTSTVAATLTDQKTITIGDTFDLVQVQDPFQYPTESNYQNVQIVFFTESQSDLVNQLPNRIYFRAFRAMEDGSAGEPFEFKGATLKTYDPLLPSVPVTILQTNVQTTAGGYGTLDEIIVNKNQTMFLEIQFEDWDPIYGSYETVEERFYPTKEKVILEDGTIRFPIIIEGLQQQAANIYYNLQLATSDGFPFLKMFNYESEFLITSLGPLTSNDYIFGYANSFFYVRLVSDQAPDVKLPPVLVFNSFPVPGNFSNLLLDQMSYITGIAQDSTQSTAQVAYQDGANSYFSFSAETISYTFYENIASDLETLLGTAFFGRIGCMTADQFTASINAADKLESILKLKDLFAQLPFAGAYDSQYFGKYGPIDDQVPHLYSPLATTLLEGYPMILPEIVMSIPEKSLANDQDLIVEISTTLQFDTDEVYLLQIQQKETIIYQEVLTLEKRMAKEKFLIEASKFPLDNGGILQVNLQRVKPDFQDFLDVVEEKTKCDLTTISSAFRSMTYDLQVQINETADYEIMDYPMDVVIDGITINIPGAECLLVGPDLVSRFYELSGTILIFKHPAKVAHTKITTASCANNLCSPSQQVVFQASNYLLDGTTVSTSAAGTYKATIIIAQESPLNANTFYDTFILDQVFLENLIDFVGLKELDPLFSVVPILSNLTYNSEYVTNTNIDFVLVASALRHLVFQTKIYQILGNDLDFNDYFTRALPKTGEQLSQMFGYNFLESDHNLDPIFSETDIRNYIDDGSIEDNIVPLQGSSTEFNGTIINPEFFINQTAAIGSNAYNWGSRRPATYSSATYNRYQALYKADTLYFASNVATNPNGGLIINVDTPDNAGDYYVYIYEYSDQGYTVGFLQFKVLPAIDFDFTLPESLSVGDNVNITMNIINGMKQSVFSVTPSLTAGSPNVVADFTYTRWSRVRNVWTPSPGFNVYTLAASDVTKLVPFKITAAKPGSVDVSITFTIRLVNAASPAFTVVKTKTINILTPQTQKNTFASYVLASNEHETYPFAQDATFDMNLPAAQSDFGAMKVTLFPTGSSFGYYNTYRESQFAGQLPATLIDLLGSAQKLLAIKQSVDYAQEENPQYKSVASEGETTVIALIKHLEAFQVVDIEGNRRGWDLYRFTDQQQGDPVITAEVISFLISQYDAVLSWDEDLTADLPNIISENADWLLTLLENDCQINTASFPPSSYLTSDMIAVSTHIAYHLTEALQNDGLNINIISPTQVDIIEQYLGSCFDNDPSDPLSFLADSIISSAPLNTSPYQLSMIALAAGNYFDYAGITTPARLAQLQLLLSQLDKHVLQYGQVVTPVELATPTGYTHFDLSRDINTVYGFVGLEKEVTIATQTAQVFKRFGTGFEQEIDLIAQYLVSISENGEWGHGKSSAAAVEIVGQHFYPYKDGSCKVRVEIEGVSFKDITIPVGYNTPIEIVIRATDIPQARFTAGSVNVNVDIYDLDAPHVNGAENEDVLMGVTFSYLSMINDQPSWPVYTHDLELSVSSLQANTSLGSADTLGQTFEWSVTVVNQNPNRPTGGLVVRVAPPSCITYDPAQFNAALGGSFTDVVHYWQDAGEHSTMVYIRNIPAGEMMTFNYEGIQSHIGVCDTRVHSVEFQTGANVIVFAVPDSYYNNGI